MTHEARIAKAFAVNGIRSVLVVDDAYDPPELDEVIFGALLEFLEKEGNRKRIVEKGVGEDVVQTALHAPDGEDGALGKVYRFLYRGFVSGQTTLDPDGHFERSRGSALKDLRPLRMLLEKCRECGEDVRVDTVGLEDSLARCEADLPEVLFLDYYLSHDVPAVGDVGEEALGGARRQSLDFLKNMARMTEERAYPAVVLMSSRHIGDRDAFRRQAGKKIVPLRFRTLSKRELRIDGDSVVLDHGAADALLDTFQGYRFGKLFQGSLSTWKDGVRKALGEFEHAVRQWDTRDIAYLSRFRLREEEQPLSEYLEWLFGGYFSALMERHVDWGHDAIRKLESDEDVGGDIEGGV